MKNIDFKIKEIGVGTTQAWQNVLKQTQDHWRECVGSPFTGTRSPSSARGKTLPLLRSWGSALPGLRASGSTPPGGMLDRLVREMNVQEKIVPHKTT